jgi:tetratricopeptide (TPR) repeat protein
LSQLERHVAALLGDPTSEDAARLVRETARAEKAFAEYARAFSERARLLAARDENTLAIDALVEAALVYEEELSDLETAVDRYRKVLEIAEDHRRAMFALGTLLHDLSRWDDLIALYRRRLTRSNDDGERTTLHLYIAELLSERLGDAHAAFEEVKTASRLAPQNIRIISRLQQLGERTQRVEEVAVVIGDLIMNQEDPKIRAALSLRLAELHLGPLNDHQRALAYLKAALVDDGGNPEILQGVEDVFRERQRFDELAEVLEATAGERREGPHRVRLERELARIFELELEDYARALQALNRALKINPEDRELLDEVMRLGLVGGELATVAQVYEWVTATADNALLKTYLRLKLGHIYANVLGQHADATRVYWAILDDEPSHGEARRRLMKLHERRDEFEQMARLLELEVTELGPSKDAVQSLERLADLYTKLDDKDALEKTNRRIVEIDPEHSAAQVALASPKIPTDDLRLDELVGSSAVEVLADEAPTEFEGDGYHPEQETLFGPPKRTPRTPPPAPPAPSPPPPAAQPDDMLLFEDSVELVVPLTTGEIELGRKTPPPPPIGDEEDSITESAPQRRRPPPPPPPDPPPPRELIEQDTINVSDARIEAYVDAPAQREIDLRLAKLQVDLQAATAAEDRPRVTSVLEEVVRVTEQIGQTERAFFSMVRLVQLEPTRARLEETVRLGRKAQAYPLLIDTVQKVAGAMGRETSIELGLLLVEVEHEDLEDPAAAIARLEDLQMIAEDDPRVFGRLLELLSAGDRHEDRIHVLLDRAQTREAPDAWPLVQQAATIAESTLGEPKRAVSILTDFVPRASNQTEVQEQAAAILERSGAWEDLVAFLSSRLSRLEGEERAALRLRIASIYEEHLDDPDAAEKMVRIGLEERARDERLLAALERIAHASGRWEDVVEARIRRLDVIENAKARSELRREIALTAEKSLGRIELALDMLTSALAEDPKNLELMDEIERLRRDQGDWDGVVDVLVLRVDALSDREEKARTWVTIAGIRADIHHDLQAASDALGAALAVVPRHKKALELLASVAERRGDRDRAIETLQRLSEQQETGERARLMVRIGRMLAARGDEADALTKFEAAHELDPMCLDALLALLPVAETAGDFVRAQELAARAAELSVDRLDRAELRRRAGQLALFHLGDELKALDHFQHVLADDPHDLNTQAAVGELLLSRQDHEGAYPHLIAAAAGISDAIRAAELYRAAGLAAERLGKQEDALSAFVEALVRVPTMREPLERLSAILERRGDHQRTYDLSATLILHHEAAMAPIERAPVYLRMARAKHHLRDAEAAARLARKAHALAEDLVEPLEILADALAELGDAFEAAEALRKMAALVRDPRSKRDALVKGARLLARARDEARAAAMLSEAQTFSPEDEEVANLLARHREELGDAAGAAEALTIPARLSAGRTKADLLLRAARIAAGPGRDRLRAKELLIEAVGEVPTHEGARGDLEVMHEFDGELPELASLLERAAAAFLEDESTAVDAGEGDRTDAAISLYERAIEIYRHRLEAPERALAVSRKLLELAPEPRHREEYARLLDDVVLHNPTSASRLLDESINAWSELVERNPGYVDGLVRLMNLRAMRGQEELARLIKELIEALGHSVELHAPINGNASRAIDTQMINAVRAVKVPPHPDEDSALSAMFAGLGYAPLKAFLEEIPEPHAKKRDLVGAAGLGIHVSRPLEYAVGLLGLEMPQVFVRDDAPDVVIPRFVGEQPALVVSVALAGKRSQDELRFLIGRCLSLLRPRSLALAVVPLDVLRDGLAGLARMDDPVSPHGDPRLTKKRGRALEKAIPQGSRARLIDLAAKWLADPQRPTLARERAAVHRTADRSGLVVSRSLSAAIGALRLMSEGRVERAWHLPLLKFASTRAFADLVKG